ncbi:unnamed protein product [Medioppia subpectinata]|uniref:Uncharacterized protein n=1 Tax=Medioppia subpectinata TaxID=1979941 RepID=A0A7R9KY61_9ACAR|nr:unnamed protein product [Medioppia subpectinata]CAG2112005.1 unnamed protein product [Medioppia subpectinata]
MPPLRPYDQLFPWPSSLAAFSRYLADQVVYFDRQLLAISKPWGVGIHRPQATITDKNGHLLQMAYHGSPRYCIREALEPLAALMGVKRLTLVKSCERFTSGIILLAADEPTAARAQRCLRRSAALSAPAMQYLCVTKGWPTIEGGQELTERVGIKLLELDELGDHKQPIIVPAPQLTKSMRQRRKPQADGMIVKPVLCRLKTLNVNKSYGVALVELSTNITKYSFIECYLANKASFVLGDTRFSRQVQHIMGTPMSIKPTKMNYSQDIEPLADNILKRLGVKTNGQIPVLVHHHRLTLPYYFSKKGKQDLVIECPKLPDHFQWTLQRLALNPPELTAGAN